MGSERQPEYSQGLNLPQEYGSPTEEELNQFMWWETLSENGQQLYNLLIMESGDTDTLPLIAAEDEWDLEAALYELRGWGFLDESDPERIKFVKSRLFDDED